MALGDHHRVADGLLEIQGQLAGPMQNRDVLEEIAGVDPPAAVGTDVNRAVVAVDGENLVGRVRPALGVVELDRVGCFPVAGVDQLLAAKLFVEVPLDFAVEAVHRLGVELELVVEPSFPATLTRLGPLPDQKKAHDTLRTACLPGPSRSPRRGMRRKASRTSPSASRRIDGPATRPACP